MKFIRNRVMTAHQAKELEHMNFVVRFVGMTMNGAIFGVWAK